MNLNLRVRFAPDTYPIDWRKKYGTITTSTGETTCNDEILKLKKELQQVQLENEILKKAVAIFSKEQKIK